MWSDQAKERIARTDAQVGLLVKNLKTGETLFSHNPDMIFPSCSVIKVPILLTLIDEAAAGKENLGEAAPVHAGEAVGGAGLVSHLSENLPVTLRDHAVFMITLSDNASTNKLISALGFKKINMKIQELGMKDTILERKMMDFEARAQGKDNFTSCSDMLTIFTHLYSDAKYEDALTILKQQQLNSLLPALLDSDTVAFAHKTGGLPGVRHDVGIMYLKDPIFIAFMSKDFKQLKDAVRLANDIGLMIFESYK